MAHRLAACRRHHDADGAGCGGGAGCGADAGCGSGPALQMAAQRGTVVSGLDASGPLLEGGA